MIFPILQGILSMRQAPVTWLLVALNAVMMISTFSLNFESQVSLEEFLKDDLFLKTNGQIFSQFVAQNKEDYPPTLRQLASLALDGDETKTKLLGTVAIRDSYFMDEAMNFKFHGDQVARRWWTKRVDELRLLQDNHPSYIFGLSSSDVGWSKWITYQFIHSGELHFLGNMIFLFIFGSALEPVIGGLALLVIYLASGMIAAGAFLVISGVSSIPLIGASGAVSGLMALFCFIHWLRPVRYIYFLFIPRKGYSGFVFLPAWIILVMWAASDLAGYLSTLDEFGGVAYAAHLGGETCGLVVGAIVYLLRYRRPTHLPTVQSLGA